MTHETQGRRICVMLLDFQNEFTKPGGKLHENVAEMMQQHGMLEKVPQIVKTAREQGALLIHSPVIMKAGIRFVEADFDPHAYAAMDGLFLEDTWNSQFTDEIQPLAGEEILRGRNDFCAFQGTELLAILTRHKIDTLVICGFLSNVCVKETASATKKNFPGMEVIVCSDGCAAKTQDEHTNTMEMSLPGLDITVMSCFDAEKDVLVNPIRTVSEQHPQDMMHHYSTGRNKSRNAEDNTSTTTVDKFQREVASSISDLQNVSIATKSDMFDSFSKSLVIMWMPFFYGAATRLPFIYYVIHLDMYFGLSWVNIGLCVAAYQGARVVTSALSIYIPRISHFLGTCLGLAGYITVLLCNNDSILPFVIGTAIIGFSETLSSMQKYAKEIYKNDPDRKKGQTMLKYQYASVMIGVVFAFSIGGFVYQKYKINGVAVYGIIVEGGELLALVLFSVIEKKQEQATNTDATTEIEVVSPKDETKKEEHQKRDLEEHKDVSFRTSLAINAHTTYATSDIGPTWINWLICLSFGVEALTIGFNLSVGPIFILQTFDKDTGIIGVLFAVGAASGSFVAIGVTCTSFGNKLMRRIVLPPFDICFAMCGIGVGVLVAAIPNFPGHVVGLILLMCFNDLGATLMTELQASITTASNYSTLAPAGQVVRRSLNVVTALTGPVLYGIIPRLPYYVAGGVTLAWTIMIFILFKIRADRTIVELSTKTGVPKREIKPGWSFATREVIHTSYENRGSLIGKRELTKVAEADSE